MSAGAAPCAQRLADPARRRGGRPPERVSDARGRLAEAVLTFEEMLWVFLGILLVTALIKAHQRQRARLPDPNDPRWTAPPRPQIAGRPCAECGLKLVTAGEGMPCTTCEEIVHVDACHTRHVASTHGVKTDMPYR